MSREPVKVISCYGDHGEGWWSHSVLAYKARVICSVDQEPGEPPVIHGYCKNRLAPGTLCTLRVDDDGFPELLATDHDKRPESPLGKSTSATPNGKTDASSGSQGEADPTSPPIADGTISRQGT